MSRARPSSGDAVLWFAFPRTHSGEGRVRGPIKWLPGEEGAGSNKRGSVDTVTPPSLY